MERRRAVRAIIFDALGEAGLSDDAANAARRALTHELSTLETIAQKLPS